MPGWLCSFEGIISGVTMARKNYHCSETTFERWIKEGRGEGRNREYKPWITVRDLASMGRSHRVFGHKSQRTHHLFSDLELAVFLILEWHIDTVEIREQFPLQRHVTLKLAEKAGIKHPSDKGVMQYLSSDFLVNSSNPTYPKFVLQAKYTDALADPRTIEKLELERRYWKEKGVPWLMVTEKEIQATVFENIEWLYPIQGDEFDPEKLVDLATFYSKQFDKYPNHTLIEIGKKIDAAYEQDLGEALLDIRVLLARRCFMFDLYIPIRKLVAKDLNISNISVLAEASRVQN